MEFMGRDREEGYTLAQEHAAADAMVAEAGGLAKLLEQTRENLLRQKSGDVDQQAGARPLQFDPITFKRECEQRGIRYEIASADATEPGHMYAAFIAAGYDLQKLNRMKPWQIRKEAERYL